MAHPYSKTVWVDDSAPAVSAANLNKIEQAIYDAQFDAFKGLPTRVTVLPASPYDGQEVYFVASASDGWLWHLRYNAASASAYKWEFVGGPGIATAGSVATDQAIADTAGAWSDGSPVVSITVPLAGDYNARAWSRVAGTGTDVVQSLYMGVKAVAGNSAPTLPGVFGGYRSDQGQVYAEENLTALAASAVVRQKFLVAGTGLQIRDRGLVVTPLRVG